MATGQATTARLDRARCSCRSGCTPFTGCAIHRHENLCEEYRTRIGQRAICVDEESDGIEKTASFTDITRHPPLKTSSSVPARSRHTVGRNVPRFTSRRSVPVETRWMIVAVAKLPMGLSAGTSSAECRSTSPRLFYPSFATGRQPSG